MLFIDRKFSERCLKDLKTFPVVTLTGPRQSGKSTLLRKLLPTWTYVNLEEPSNLDFATQDPRGFIKTYQTEVIFDEVQRVPTLLSQIQVEVDRERRPGRFAVTGSHNLHLLQSVSQSLAGRTSVRHLLPFSYAELLHSEHIPSNLEATMFYGGYPPALEYKEDARAWFDSYIQTYIERDVRLIRNVNDLGTFRRFLRLCAGRAGQLLDQSGIGNDAGVSHNTVRDWINVLEAGFIAFRLEPYFNNFSKRIIKSPKLYFYDTGILCRLLEIRSPEELTAHPFRGAVFENWCIVEALKRIYSGGDAPSVYFWRDQVIEVDMLLKLKSNKLHAIECKSAATPDVSFIDSALTFKSIAKGIDVDASVVYGGDQTQNRSQGNFIGWQDYSRLLYEW
jgi:predicted AAA+ superfamily ATPase